MVLETLTTECLDQTLEHLVRRQRSIEEIEGRIRSLETRNRHLEQQCENARRFVDNVSHDFRTPLTVINEYCHLLRDGSFGAMTENQCQILDIISDRSCDLNNMVDDMLDVSKLEAGRLGVRRRRCRLSDILGHVHPSLHKKATVKGVELTIESVQGLPEVYCDPDTINRVLVNLAINAIKFCDTSGRVNISATLQSDSQDVKVQIEDSGRGIPPDQLDSIFQRFRQVESDPRDCTKGFGLGLNIAKELVDLNYGRLDVESSVGEGSTFSFTIPAALPREVTKRYLSRITTRYRAESIVSLIQIEIASEEGEETADNVDHFLSDFQRRDDVIFRICQTKWILIHPATASDLHPFIARIEECRNQVNRNRPNDLLVKLDFRILGTWDAASRSADILDQVEFLLSSEEPQHA